MGAALIRSAFSANIKERRDCSTAIFDAAGRMTAQAEHMPVHLGAMPASVAAVLELDPGPEDVYILNDPYAGGTHLPDITLVSRTELGFAASRAHYADVGGTFKQGTPDEVAVQEDVNTRKGVERIIRAAFEWARANGKTRVTMSDKSNAMEFAGGLWRRVFKLVSAEYPDIESEALYVDMLAMDMVRRPERYQVIVTGNLFGDILSDLGAQLAGGLGLSPSGNIHPGRIGLFEPVHGSAPDLAGRDLANPFAAVLTAGLMLEHLGRPELGKRLEDAVRDCIVAGETTPDLGGSLGTAAAGDAIVRRVAATS
jgi:isocitrate/isopropylmalate dehydrogenase